MFSIKTFADVITVAKTFGRPALDHAIAHSTLSQDANEVIFKCISWAASQVVSIENVNDGNVEYSVAATFQYEDIAGKYITQLQDITIVRQGFGAYSVSVQEAMTKGYITAQTLGSLINEIQRRNDAAKDLAL